MNALSVARAVNSTTLTRPSTAATPITPTAVILNPPFFDPAAPIMSASARLTLSNTPIAFRARYSTEVATIAMKNSTNDTAKLNFITDHGSMRLRNSRARRGPRAAAAETAARPVLTLAGGADDGAASGESGGGAIPGARVNFGGLPSPTVARPTTGRPEAALSGDSAPSESAGEVEVPAPGVACVSVMN